MSEQQTSSSGGRAPGAVTALIVGVIAGTAGGWGAAWFQMQGIEEAIAARPPVAVLDAMAIAGKMSGSDKAEKLLAMIGNLRDAGYVVVDSRSVLAAPAQFEVQGPEGGTK